MRRFECIGNLARQTHCFLGRDGTAQRFALEVFEDEGIDQNLIAAWVWRYGAMAHEAVLNAVMAPSALAFKVGSWLLK